MSAKPLNRSSSYIAAREGWFALIVVANREKSATKDAVKPTHKPKKGDSVGEEKAKAAAEAIAGYENRFAAIERKLAVLTWQMNVVIAGIAALVLKAFFIS